MAEAGARSKLIRKLTFSCRANATEGPCKLPTSARFTRTVGPNRTSLSRSNSTALYPVLVLVRPADSHDSCCGSDGTGIRPPPVGSAPTMRQWVVDGDPCTLRSANLPESTHGPTCNAPSNGNVDRVNEKSKTTKTRYKCTTIKRFLFFFIARNIGTNSPLLIKSLRTL